MNTFTVGSNEYRIVYREYASGSRMQVDEYVMQEFAANYGWQDTDNIFSSLTEVKEFIQQVKKYGGFCRDTVVNLEGQ